MFYYKKNMILFMIFITIFLLGCSNGYNKSSFSQRVEIIRDAESFTLQGEQSVYYYEKDFIYFENDTEGKPERFYYDIVNDKFYVYSNENWYLDDYRFFMLVDIKTQLKDAANKDFLIDENGGLLQLSGEESIYILNDNYDSEIQIRTNLCWDKYIIKSVNETTVNHPNLDNALINEVTDIHIQAFFSDTDYYNYTYESIDWTQFMYLYANTSAYSLDKPLDFNKVNPTIDFLKEPGVQRVTVTYYGLSYEFDFFFFDPSEPIILSYFPQVMDGDSPPFDLASLIGYCYVSELDTCTLAYEDDAFDVVSWHIIEEGNGNGYFGDYTNLTINAKVRPNLQPISFDKMLDFYELSELNFIKTVANNEIKKYFMSKTEIYDVSNNQCYIYTDLVNHESHLLYDYASEWEKTEEVNSNLVLEEILELVKELEFTTSIGHDQKKIFAQYRVELNPNEHNGIKSIAIDFVPDSKLIRIQVQSIDSVNNLTYIGVEIYYDGNPYIDPNEMPFETELKKPEL